MADKNSNDRSSQNSDDSSKRDRTIGEGMNSLDSTQAPLKAETGEPDWDAMTDKGGSRNPQNQKNGSSEKSS
jgi:hypothetical protein